MAEYNEWESRLFGKKRTIKNPLSVFGERVGNGQRRLFFRLFLWWHTEQFAGVGALYFGAD